MGWGIALMGLLAAMAGAPMERVAGYGGSAVAVVVVGNTAWVSAGAALCAYDIADPKQPRATGARLALPGIALHLAARGQTVFAACERVGIVAADVGNASAPRLVGTTALSRSWAGLVVADKWLYGLAAEDGLHVWDAADPARPADVGKSHTPSIGRALAVSNGYAYVLDLEGGLGVYDVSEPSDPRRQSYCDLPQAGLALALRGKRLLAICENQTLQAFDVDNPGEAKRIGLLHLSAMPRTLCVKDDTAYVGTEDGFLVVDVSDTTNPLLARTLPQPALAA
ncbi:MAG: hypothetical protein HZB16_22565, partial [Armatimonadetes bacterium]|nr:hypothetical protein [Armatimonadota bacterium]